MTSVCPAKLQALRTACESHRTPGPSTVPAAEQALSKDSFTWFIPVSLFSIEKPLALPWERGGEWQVGPITFQLQQIIQSVFQILNMILRLIQHLPLRTETDDAEKSASHCRDWFCGHRCPFPGLRPCSLSCRATALDIVDKKGRKSVLMRRRRDVSFVSWKWFSQKYQSIWKQAAFSKLLGLQKGKQLHMLLEGGINGD